MLLIQLHSFNGIKFMKSKQFDSQPDMSGRSSGFNAVKKSETADDGADGFVQTGYGYIILSSSFVTQPHPSPTTAYASQ